MDKDNFFVKRAYLVLRVGLAAVFIWAGVDMIRNPSDWQGFIPPWLLELLPYGEYEYLFIHGTFEILLAVSFLSGFLVWISAPLAVLEFAGILIFVGVDQVTFRDIGLLGAAWAMSYLAIGFRINPKPRINMPPRPEDIRL